MYRLTLPPCAFDRAARLITLSGGVGQLVYDLMLSPIPLRKKTRAHRAIWRPGRRISGAVGRFAATCFSLSQVIPEGLGRATVFGLLRHSTEVSGTTIYLPQPERLPLKNVPLVGPLQRRLHGRAACRQLLELAAAGQAGRLPASRNSIRPASTTSRLLGDRLAKLLADRRLPLGHTLGCSVGGQLGKGAGQLYYPLGYTGADVVVVDEVPSSGRAICSTWPIRARASCPCGSMLCNEYS